MAFACCVTCNRARAQEERCGAGKDLVVQALERVTPSSSDDEFEDALQLLKHAVSTCGELGDAWYYRSLVEQRLGHASLAQYSMDKARMFSSDAMQQGAESLRAGDAAGETCSDGECAAEWRAGAERTCSCGSGPAEMGVDCGHRPF